jgi:hypothetical protein
MVSSPETVAIRAILMTVGQLVSLLHGQIVSNVQYTDEMIFTPLRSHGTDALLGGEGDEDTGLEEATLEPPE